MAAQPVLYEISVTVDSRGQYRLGPLRNGKPCRKYIPDLIAKEGHNLCYVFESPTTLKRVLETLTGSVKPQGTAMVLVMMQKIRLCVGKVMLQIDESTVSAPLPAAVDLEAASFEDWKRVSQAIPSGHQVREIRFDLAGLEHSDLVRVGELLREVYGQMQTKSDAIVACRIVGCTEVVRDKVAHLLVPG